MRRSSPSRHLAAPLLVLALAAVTTAAAPSVIRVRRGDTLWELARKHGTTVEALQELNGLRGSLIFDGQQLRLRPVTAPAAPAARRPAAPRVQVVELAHVVRTGDSLIRIARRYGVEPATISTRNKLPRSGVVRLGQRLVITQRRTVPAAPAAVRPLTVSKARVRELLVAEARRRKVDPNLVVALAWQESGLQQHVVSSTGALGVMQVMPGTGDWVSRYLAKRPLNLRDLEDNIEAGVRYLRQLISITKSTDEALAGYYQGLASVRKRGMYSDTVRYVANIQALRRRLASR